jgi:glycine C-acetyltransferase/8-amino-7-oxononanoate synthase
MNFEMQSPMGARTVVNGRAVDYYAGTGYLGLQNHPSVRQAALDTLKQYGLSNAGGYGNNHPVYKQLTAAILDFFQAEKALYFASGYLGNAILAQGLRERYEHIFVDEEAHYSVWDGARTTARPINAFRHRDTVHLKELCAQKLRSGERPLIMTDGVFPCSGAIAPVPELAAVARQYGGLLCLDDAHATAVLGDHGWGTLEHFGIEDANCFTCHTLSKALGGFGGFIVGNASLIDELLTHVNVHEGASLAPMPAAAAATASLQLLKQKATLRDQLQHNVKYARNRIRALGWDLEDTVVPILCLDDQGKLDLIKIQEDLFAYDICVAHTAHYTSVPKGGALRIAIFATHSTEQIDRLYHTLGDIL